MFNPQSIPRPSGVTALGDTIKPPLPASHVGVRCPCDAADAAGTDPQRDRFWAAGLGELRDHRREVQGALGEHGRRFVRQRPCELVA